MQHYIPDEDWNLIPVDFMTWARWSEQNERHLAFDTLTYGMVEVRVSTVFLGFDHGHTEFFGGRPLFFETMAFLNLPQESGFPGQTLPWTSVDASQRRYTTKEEALEGHAEAVMLVKSLFNTLPEGEAQQRLLSAGLEETA